MAKTSEEVERLKVDWKSDPCWDIETTEGFEDHYEELAKFSEKCNREWKQKDQEKQEADPLYQAKKRVQEVGIDVVNGDATVPFADNMTFRAMTYALIAIAEELRRANDDKEVELEREETRRLYQ